jgi:hypothetical protein
LAAPVLRLHRKNHRLKAMIYISVDGNQTGPFTVEQINAMLRTGQVKPLDMAWWEGCPEWVPVQSAAGIQVPAQVGVVQNPSSVPVRRVGATKPVAAASASVYAPPQGALVPGATAAGQVSAGTVQALRETRPWVLFLAILASIGTGLMLLAGLMAILGGAMAGASAGVGGAPMGIFAIMGLFYLLFAVLYLYPIIKLYKYSGAISRLSRTGAVRDLEDALRQQKGFWKFLGIVTLVVIALYIVAIVLVFVVGVGAAGAFSGRPGGLP